MNSGKFQYACHYTAHPLPAFIDDAGGDVHEPRVIGEFCALGLGQQRLMGEPGHLKLGCNVTFVYAYDNELFAPCLRDGRVGK